MRACPRCRASYSGEVDRCGLDGERLVESDTDPLIGAALDRYRVLERLGAGAMGSVYRARHTVLEHRARCTRATVDRMAQLRLGLIAVALAGCGEDSTNTPDAGMPLGGDASTSDAAGVSGCRAPPHEAACDDAMCLVPAGCFRMGSAEDELCRDPGEVLHEVQLTRDYLLSRRELTRREVRDGFARCYACTAAGHDVRCTPAPEFAASIYDCPGYRHPTEAEWEYAYRAGTDTALYSGTISSTCASDPRADEIAWYAANSRGAVHAPGGRRANAWGLEDMAGNLFEWTFDRAAALEAASAVDPAVPISGELDEMIMRSGSWDSDLRFLRAAARVPFPAHIPVYALGGRLARTLPRGAARPIGVSALSTADVTVESCSPNELAAPIQTPARPRVHLAIPFEGREQLLLVDTGAPHSTFYLPPSAPPLAPGVGLVAIGCEQAPFYGRNVRSGQVVRGLPVLGAIGTDWLLSRPTALDLAEQSLIRWASAAEIPDLDSLVRLPFDLVAPGYMLVRAKIDGTDVRLMLDTGTPRTLWIGPAGSPNDPEVVLMGEWGDEWTVREGDGRIELAGEAALMQPIWRAPALGALETFLRGLAPDVVGILGLASFERRRVYFGAREGEVLLGPR